VAGRRQIEAVPESRRGRTPKSEQGNRVRTSSSRLTVLWKIMFWAFRPR